MQTEGRGPLSSLGVWALAFGCAVGWGAFVMPGTTFLPDAGPLGTAIGMGVGAAVMLIIGMNYHYLMGRWPGPGGTLTYATRTFGHDHGFLSAWFLVLVYVAIMWANASALPLIGRYLLGDTLQFGFHYVVLGYDVYLGEALVSMGALVLVGAVCLIGRRLAVRFQTLLAVLLFVGILVCFVAVLLAARQTGSTVKPDFSPKSQGPVGQIIHIIVLAPWAFVGFESVSHSSGEFRFRMGKVKWILVAALVTGGVSYVLLTWMAASLRPEGFANWSEYIAELGKLSGVAGLPTFYAAEQAMGQTGVAVLAVTVTAGILTGLLGNLIAASRLLTAMAEEGILPAWFGKHTGTGIPKNAVLFLVGISLAVPFFGRTTIGWIVDVNTIGATIVYGYTSAAAWVTARRENGPKWVRVTGALGLAASIGFFFYFMASTADAMQTESYLLLAGWSILGFVFFRHVFKKDTQRRFGKSTVVWIGLLFLIFFTSLMWVRQATADMTRSVVSRVSAYYEERNPMISTAAREDNERYLQEQMDQANDRVTTNSFLQMALMVGALAIMFSVYKVQASREKEMEIQKVQAEENSRAKSTFLSNMSHDIRTPMNAIIGYTTLARREKDTPPKVAGYLEKIDRSSHHLLALINDVLEMSRIESGKLELDPTETDIVRTLEGVQDMFATQMEEKGLVYRVETRVEHRWVRCDENRLNRVLLNLVSNAYKFTPKGGSVTVTLEEVRPDSERAGFRLQVADTGIGMSQEFAAKVFEAFEQERSSTVSGIQGTGLGMAITKSIVELMAGDISVQTRQGEGTTFTILLELPVAQAREETREQSAAELDFTGFKLLMAEDNEINREIALELLEERGFTVDAVENGQEAVEKLRAAKPGDYDAVLMDVQMPVMNGYDATRAIRGMADPAIAGLPIIAMTANAFAEDVAAAKAAGMDAHIAKPLDVEKLMQTLAQLLGEKKGSDPT